MRPFPDPCVEATSAATERLNFGVWCGRIVGWDGLLPLTIFACASGIAAFFPRNQGIQTLTLLVLPIVAFFCRANVGLRQINANTCGRRVRNCQRAAFGFALLLLVSFDFMLVLLRFIPPGRRQPPPDDVPIWIGMIVAYLLLAAFAMYPGRRVTHPEQ